MSQVAAPADRRFRRAHVKPARHRRTWRSFATPTTVALVVVTILATVALRGLARSGVLQVNHIVVHGNERLSKGEVMAMLEGL
jgi:hypothetical protein